MGRFYEIPSGDIMDNDINAFHEELKKEPRRIITPALDTR